jgi:cell division protein FtsQ
LFLLAVGVLTASAVVVLRSGYLRVQDVQITGGENVSREALADALRVEGRGMWEVDEEAIVESVAADPAVRSVTVSREWPDTVAIAIEERQAWGYWQIGNQLYAVDTDGVTLGHLVPADDAPLIVQLRGPAHLRDGDHVDLGALRTVDALRALESGSLELNAVAFEWAPDLGLVVETEAGVRAVLGDGQDLESKLAVWSATLHQAKASGITVREIDLRFGARPAIRAKRGRS